MREETSDVEYDQFNCVLVLRCGCAMAYLQYILQLKLHESRHSRYGFLKEQMKFQDADLVRVDNTDEHVDIPFLDIYDKGSRPRMAAYNNGKQMVLQPHFAKSDKEFNHLETYSSASVATDHGGNKRAVNLGKRARYLSSGFKLNMCPKRYNTAWLV